MDNATDQERPDPNKAGAWNSTGAAVKVYKCHRFDCDFETTELLPKCPECGFNMLDPVTVRFLGVLMAVLGGVLALGGAIALFFLGKTLLERGGAGYMVLGIFGVMLAAGAVKVGGGIKQAITANKSSNLIALMAALFVLLAIFAAIMQMIR